MKTKNMNAVPYLKALRIAERQEREKRATAKENPRLMVTAWSGIVKRNGHITQAWHERLMSHRSSQ